MFSLLIAFVHFTNFRVFHHCFFRCFFFTTDFYYCFSGVFISPTFFTITFFLRERESFFNSRAFFTLHSFPNFHSLLLSRFHWEPAVLPRSLHGLQLRFRTQTPLIGLFELHSVQQKVLVGRFYLCVKALRNTISTPSRF